MNELLDAEAQEQIAAAFKKFGFGNIGGARESLGNKFDYGLFRIYRAAKSKVGGSIRKLRFDADRLVCCRAQHAILVRPLVNPARGLIIAKFARRLFAFAIRINLRRAGKNSSAHFAQLRFNAVQQFFKFRARQRFD